MYNVDNILLFQRRNIFTKVCLTTWQTGNKDDGSILKFVTSQPYFTIRIIICIVEFIKVIFSPWLLKKMNESRMGREEDFFFIVCRLY